MGATTRQATPRALDCTIAEPRLVEDTLIVESLEDGRAWRLPRATRPAFSDDGRWLAYRMDLAGATGSGSRIERTFHGSPSRSLTIRPNSP